MRRIWNCAVCILLLAGIFAGFDGDQSVTGAAVAPATPTDPNAIIVDKKAHTVSIPARVQQQGTQKIVRKKSRLPVGLTVEGTRSTRGWQATNISFYASPKGFST